MRIVIVEDEYLVAKRLKRFVENSFAETTISLQLFDCLDEAMDYIASNCIDVLFLDLNLQGEDGFDLLKQQVSLSFHTIVVSANIDRAIDAFDIGVLDFIAKPFTLARVQKAVTRLLQKNVPGQCKYLSYKNRGEVSLLPIGDILYLKAAGHYTEIYTRAGTTVLHDKNLEKLLCILPKDFERIHRSYAVSIKTMASISALEGSKYILRLKNGTELPIGRTRLKMIKMRMIGSLN